MKDYYGYKRKVDPRVAMWRRIKWAMFFALIGAAIFFAWQFLKKNPEWSEMLGEYKASVSNWIANRKQKIHTTVAKVRQQVGEGDGTPAEVTFQFYDTLQDMKAMQAKPEVKTVADKTKAVVKPKHPAKVSHTADLENDILAAMKKNQEDIK